MKRRGLYVALLLILSLFVGFSHAVSVGANPATKPIDAKSLDAGCDPQNPDEWHFIITGITADNAPKSISATFVNAGNVSIQLVKVSGEAAHYSTGLYLDDTLLSATAEIFVDWSGQFNLSHSPCVSPTDTPYPTDTATEVATDTPTVEITPTDTATVENTPTDTATPAATETGTVTVKTPTNTSTPVEETATTAPSATNTPVVTPPTQITPPPKLPNTGAGSTQNGSSTDSYIAVLVAVVTGLLGMVALAARRKSAQS